MVRRWCSVAAKALGSAAAVNVAVAINSSSERVKRMLFIIGFFGEFVSPFQRGSLLQHSMDILGCAVRLRAESSMRSTCPFLVLGQS